VVVASGDADARELLSRVLARAGHEVEQVETPDAALSSLAGSARVALVALFHGDQAAALVADVRAGAEPTVAAVPVVMVTDDDAAAKAVSMAGADGSLTRPFHAEELTGELDAVLARSPEERAERREAAALSPDD
jgi:DNA-binding response OmpR family regulator